MPPHPPYYLAMILTARVLAFSVEGSLVQPIIILIATAPQPQQQPPQRLLRPQQQLTSQPLRLFQRPKLLMIKVGNFEHFIFCFSPRNNFFLVQIMTKKMIIAIWLLNRLYNEEENQKEDPPA